jgi:hypothetical protein
MAIYYARATGNINGAIWATTPSGAASNLFSSFTSADTLMANNFTVTINVDTTVLELRRDTANGATSGGSFSLSAGITLTANISGSPGGSATVSFGAAGSANIVGSITGGTGDGGAVSNGGVGTLNITGNVIGGTGTNAPGVVMTGAGVTNITGNITGGSATGCTGLVNSSSAGTVNITGTVTGGPFATTFGVSNTSTGTVVIVGTAIGGTAGAGVNSSGTGTVTVTRARGNGFGNGSVGLSATVGVNAAQNSATRVYEIEYGDLGMSPTSGPIILLNDTSNVALFYRTSGGKKTLIDSSASAGHPAITNVRSGISYANGNLTGTCAVPSAGSVALGVAVDNTTGTAILTQADVETALASFSSGRLSNCATVASVGQQIIMLAEA